MTKPRSIQKLLGPGMMIVLLIIMIIPSGCSSSRKPVTRLITIDPFTIPKSAQPLPEDRFVFTYKGGELYSAHYDGTDVQRIGGSFNPGPKSTFFGCRYASISPDRRTIAFSSSLLAPVYDEGSNVGQTETGQCLYLMSADGKKKTCAIDGFDGQKIIWAPDGTGVYFAYGIIPMWIDLVKKTSTGVSGVRFPKKPAFNSTALSPSGKKIAYWGASGFVSEDGYHNSDGRIYIANMISKSEYEHTKYSWPQKVYAPWLEWVNERDLLVIDKQDAKFTYPNKNKPGQSVTAWRPYMSHITLLDTKTGKTKLLAESQPWEIFDTLSVSPDRTKAMINYWISNHDPSSPFATIQPDAAGPMPAILDLKTGKLTRIAPSADMGSAQDVNWSSP